MSRWTVSGKQRSWLVGAGVFVCLFLFASERLAAEPPPNIVFILTDDLGVNDLSCYGRKDQPTPHLDRLAEQGMRFTHAYCAQPICSPTRAALLTGKTPARLHLTTFLPGRPNAPSQLLLHPKIQQELPLAEQTIAELLKPVGYVSACLGKWHLGGAKFGPKMQGFDEAMPGKPTSQPSETEGGKGEYFLTAQAEDFLERHKDHPFFLLLSHDTPHVALAAKPELIEKHATAWNPTYAAMIETLDDCVGRVLKKLDALGLSERTIVIFTSDNGGLHVPELPLTPATHNTPFRAGKGFLYEGGLRIPLIVRWPGRVPAGSVEDYPVITTDWLPTLLEAAAVPPPANLDGSSLLGLLTRKVSPPARDLFWHFPHYTNQGGRPGGAVRSGDWKLIEHAEDGRAELFDLAQDAGETTDLAMAQPGKVAELRGKLAAWRLSVDAQQNQPNPAFDRAQWTQLYQNTDATRVEPGATYLEPRAALSAWRDGMNAALKPNPGAQLREVIQLPAKAATVHGEKLRYEPQPEKNTLGFWVNPRDWAEWKFTVAAPGRFDVQILQGCGKGSGGATVEFVFDQQTLPVQVQETGHFQNFIPRTIGAVELAPGEHTLAVRPRSKPGGAVMDLRQVTLLPVAP